MEFNVDSSIVNKTVTDSSLAITYSVPGDWSSIATSDSALAKVNASNIRVSNVLQNAAGSVVFSLTDVRKVPDSTFINMSGNYKTVLNPSQQWSNVEKASFQTKGFVVDQYVMSKQGQTFFKMLFGDRLHKSFQVDYSIIIDSNYAINTKTLESIIGSIQRTH
jgi:hypothetical protein